MRACLRTIGLGGALLVWALVFLGTPAAAQPEDPKQHTEKVKKEAPNGDETLFELAAGGILNTGNTQSWQANVGSKFRLVRGAHATAFDFAFNYGRTDPPDDMIDQYEDTVRNINMRLRYDYFLTDDDALFVAAVYRWDTFAGLDTRVQGQAGYLRNFYRAESHRAWGEIGYDITFDNFDPDPLLDDMGNILDGDDLVHSARLFLGYDNHINPAVTFSTGAELLMNVEDPEDIRINWESALRSSLVGSLQAELKFTLRFDNVPVPGATEVDTITQLTLIYTFAKKEEAAEEG